MGQALKAQYGAELDGQGVDDVSEAAAQALQDNFDSDRLEAFDFYPGIAKFLAEARKL